MLDKLLAAGAEFVSGSLIYHGRVVGRSTVDGLDMFEDILTPVVAAVVPPVSEPLPVPPPAPRRGRKPKAADVSATEDFEALINELTAE
jgi:hypothetical protein